MKATLLERLTQTLDALPPELIVALIACFPVLELRLAIPIGMSAYGLSFWQAYLSGVIGNMLPVLPLLLLFQPLSRLLLRFALYNRFYDWLYNRAMKKSRRVEQFGALGLILFTALPLPTTGAWTACAVAIFFGIRLVYAFTAILIGVLLAGIIMGIFSQTLLS
jgi:uncharacterized membrane protein